MNRGTDLCAEGLQRVIREMGVARGGLWLRMSKKLADHVEARAIVDGEGRVRVPEIMQADALEVGAVANHVPGLPKIDEVGAAPMALDDIGVIDISGMMAKNFDGLGVEVDRLAAGLAVGQPDHAAIKIDVVPLERRDLAVARAGEQE